MDDSPPHKPLFVKHCIPLPVVEMVCKLSLYGELELYIIHAYSQGEHGNALEQRMALANEIGQ